MAEYGREQRNQLSRAIANNETGSRQLKGFVDNRQRSSVMQLLTSISYDDMPGIGENCDVRYVAHTRIPMSSAEKSNAYRPNGYIVSPNEVCNHHIAYKMIRDSVVDKLIDRTIGDGLQDIQNTWGVIDAQNYYYAEEGVFNKEGVDSQVDETIGTLANAPENLFYWPFHTGDGNGTVKDYPAVNTGFPNPADPEVPGTVNSLDQYSASIGF